LITQMNQPLGRAVGHALEVKEAIAALRGEGPADFQELVEAIAGEMLLLGGALSMQHAREQVTRVIADGSALRKFRDFVTAQGGNGGQVDEPSKLPMAPVIVDLYAPSEGWVQAIDAREVGLATVDMGGGRLKKGDEIDHRVGVLLGAKVGDAVRQGAIIAQIHAADESSAAAASQRVGNAFRIASMPVEPLPVVLDRVASE
jgi:pyrimidine-nucleoside phosphorylase